jgi:sugar phosphate isomerase/epimerase
VSDAVPLQLGYCTNIHPGESADELIAAIDRHVAAVRSIVAPQGELGVGLRVSARAAAELRAPATRDRLLDALERAGALAFTLNGFPYGRFHGEPVKAAVYRPDWRERARLDYTRDLVDLLAALTPAGSSAQPSISTVPGGFARELGSADPPRIAAALIELAVELWRLREGGGATLVIALEPEPACMLETIADAVAFFAEHLHGAAAVAAFARASGAGTAESEAALRLHLGVCLDACHAAVEYEDPRGCVDALIGAGISIAKLQVTAGLELVPEHDAIAELRRFDDAVYLHQTVAQRGATLSRFLDLPDAFASLDRGELPERWRVHFHVPVFMAELGLFRSTQSFLVELLAAVRRRDACRQLEVETYTWDVLPPEHRGLPVEQAIARELQWTAAQLGS